MAELERRLSSVGRRLRALGALEEGARFGLLAAPLGLGAAAARALYPEGALARLSWGEAVLVALAPAALGAAAGALRGATRSVSRELAASLAEERASLGAVFSTALELPAQHAWRTLVAAEAEETARTLRASAVAPLRLPAKGRPLVLVLLAALAVLALPVERLRAQPQEAEKPVEKPALDALAAAGAKLREASDALPPGAGRHSLDEAGKELRTFLSDLEAGKLGKRDALARIGDAEEKLRVEHARIDARRDVRDALAADPNLSALGKGSQAAASRLADPRAREAAREVLEKAAEKAADAPELQEALEKVGRALAQATGKKEDAERVSAALSEVAKKLEGSPREEKHARAELEKAHAALEAARAAVTGEKPPADNAVTQTHENPGEGSNTEKTESKPTGDAKLDPALAKLAEKIPPELVQKALEKPGAGVSSEDAKELLDRVPPETLEKLAKAAQDAAPGKLDDAARDLPPEVKKDLEDAKKSHEETGIPPEALAKMAELIPPELLAKAMKHLQPKEGADLQQPPPISPEDAAKVLEKLSPKTIEKLAKAALEAQKNAPPRAGASGISAEQALELAKKLPPEVLNELQRNLPKPGPGAGLGAGPGAGAGPGPGTGTGARKTPGEGNSAGDPRVSSPGGTAAPDAKDPLVKNRASVGWSSPADMPAREREALRTALERKRVPASYERTVREYFDLGKPKHHVERVGEREAHGRP